MSIEPLQDEEAFNIRTKLIQELGHKNQALNDQIEKLEQEIFFNNRIIGQLREITPLGPFKASELDSLSWKKRVRKLQAHLENTNPSKQKKKKIATATL